MGNKSFRERIEEEISNFPAIYAEFVEAHNRYVDRNMEEGLLNSWAHTFEVPFENSVKQHLAENPEALAKEFPSYSKHATVIATIQELRLHELRLGAISYADPRITVALELGLLDVDDLAPLYLLSEEEQRSLGMGPIRRAEADRSDPFFWRTMLEIFCRAYIASRGRRPWPLTRKIDLAFDLDEIRQTLPNERWNKKAVLKVLRDKEPYKTKYPPSDSAAASAGVGEDRIQEITGWIGPMDDGAMERLKTLHEDLFFKVSDKRWADQRRPRDLDGIKEVLEHSNTLGDAAGYVPHRDG
jgi:hypothetical protein